MKASTFPVGRTQGCLMILATFLMSGCSDESVAPDLDPDVLVTVEVNEAFANRYGPEGYVFVTGPGGDVLDVATWSGISTLVLRSQEARPDSVSLTLVSIRQDQVELHTETGLPVGFFWSYGDWLPPALTGQAELFFENVPDCESYTVSAIDFNADGSGQPPANQTIDVHGATTDCFVRIDRSDGGPLGAWLRGIEPDESRTLDFDEPELIRPLNRYAMPFPPNTTRVTAFLGVVSMDNYIHFGSAWFFTETSDSIVVHLPRLEALQFMSDSFSWYRIDDSSTMY